MLACHVVCVNKPCYVVLKEKKKKKELKDFII